LIIIISSIS